LRVSFHLRITNTTPPIKIIGNFHLMMASWNRPLTLSQDNLHRHNIAKCIDKRHTIKYTYDVVFNWNNAKNEQLKRERGISFEQIVFLIDNDGILDILEHPQKEKYANQMLYIINVDNYAYVVPFIDKNDERFLITIFPSRKYTQFYLKDKRDKDEVK